MSFRQTVRALSLPSLSSLPPMERAAKHTFCKVRKANVRKMGVLRSLARSRVLSWWRVALSRVGRGAPGRPHGGLHGALRGLCPGPFLVVLVLLGGAQRGARGPRTSAPLRGAAFDNPKTVKRTPESAQRAAGGAGGPMVGKAA